MTPILFDAVLLDLDGTIVATDLYWLDAARRGARRAFAELGIERAQPTDSGWLSLVGLPAERGFERLFPDLTPAQRARLAATCLEEESQVLERDGARFLPGAEEGLAALAAAGLSLGVASNCGRGYLELVSRALELARFVPELRCLDSPGCHDKAAMLHDLCATFATRSAVMVGDRYTDGEAARANGLPFVHVRSGVSADDGAELAEATVADLSELPGLLARRADFIGAALDALGVGRPGGPRTVGVTGRCSAGATLLARDALRLLERRGVPARVAPLEAWRRPEPAAVAGDPLASGYDLAALSGELLEPRARGGAASPARPGVPDVPEDAICLLEGPWLLDPRVRMRVDRVLYLDASDEVRLARAAGDGRGEASFARVERLRAETWPAEQAFERRCPPAAADLVLPADGVLGARAAQGAPRA